MVRRIILAAVLAVSCTAATTPDYAVEAQLAIARSKLRHLAEQRAVAPVPKHRYIDSRINVQRDIIQSLSATKREG